MKYYAHSNENELKENWQLLKEHLLQTGKLAKNFAEKFKAGDLGYIAGLLHDIGKYSKEFQVKLEGKNYKVDHSTAGAKEVVFKYGGGIGKILSYVIAGHHAGLADYTGTGDDSCLANRLNNNALPDYSNFATEIKLPPAPEYLPIKGKGKKEELSFSVFMFIRMLYSCLVDADFLDTEKFYNIEKSMLRKQNTNLKELDEKLDEYLNRKIKESDKTELNKERLNILRQCQKKSQEEPGFFTLTVPTGGGKTLSSLSFALKQAIKNNMERIIYVIPYTSIIEQNADVFREVLGVENILEHHSNYDYEENEDDDINYKLKLASENWDMPIIATTNVQFFESLFSNKSSKSRKLHNIVNSVIILDEAQMLPVEYMKPCIYGLIELIKNYHCTVVFCTATQPALFDNPPKDFKLPEDVRPREIIEKPKDLYTKLKAVNVVWEGEIKKEDLIENLIKNERVLCIVNTRRFARELYEGLKNKGIEGIYHLSAAMCPAHRTEKIKEIKEKLGKKQKCIVVSTQLIEAGVHIDFPVVYREVAGIDSITQAAGRCNRERKIMEGGIVYVFKPSDRKPLKGFLGITSGVAEEVIRLNKEDDLLSLKNIKDYFELLYSREVNGLDEKGIIKNIIDGSGNIEYSFKSISDNFKFIDDLTYSIIVPYNKKCEDLLKQIEFTKYPGSFTRKLQIYTVQIYKQDFDKLVKNNMIRNFKDIYFILEKKAYSEEFGVKVGEAYSNIQENYIF